MKKILLIVIALGMVGFAVYDLTSSSKGSEVNQSPLVIEDEKVTETDAIGLSKGQMAPDFELETLDGETVRLSDYRGKRVIVNFWATWCPPCRAEIPDLQKIYDKKDVVILAVNLTDTEGDPKNVPEFVDEYKMTFPVPMDVTSEVASKYQVHAYPTSYMVDSNGHIQFVAIGAMNYDFMLQNLEEMK